MWLVVFLTVAVTRRPSLMIQCPNVPPGQMGNLNRNQFQRLEHNQRSPAGSAEGSPKSVRCAGAPPGGCLAAASSVRPCCPALCRRRLYAVVVPLRGETRQADTLVGAHRVDALCVLAQHHALVQFRALVHIWRRGRDNSFD